MKYLHPSLFIFLFFFCCKKPVDKKSEDNLFYKKAFVYRDKEITDSAFYYFYRAKDLFLQRKDSLSAGKCLVNMGIISNTRGDYYGAQEISLNALTFFDLQNKDQYIHIRSNFNNLGLATHNLGDYSGAIKFFNAAIELSEDSLDTRVYLNNKARAYQVLKDYTTALKLYEEVLRGVSKNKKEFARVLTNISNTKWLQDSAYNAVPNYQKALQLRIEEKDLWGQNSSYSHLSDYYTTKNRDSALFYAQNGYQIAKELNSAYDQLEAIQQLIKVSPGTDAKKYFATYKKLNDSVQNSRQRAKNQFALIRYETEKHKTDYLKAQAENVQKKNNIIIQNFILGFLALSLLSAYLWYRKRREILQQEKELEVKNTELKYVKKIHDRVANKVYQVMSEVENNPEVHRGVLLDKLEDLYNISRDISYDKDEVSIVGNYSIQLSAMLQSYSSEATKVLIVGNEEELWLHIDKVKRAELFYVLQELMTNMKKHSKASTVVLKFQDSDDFININYSDNGIGLGGTVKKNGMANTENRIKSIDGTITFESKPEEGLAIHLCIPFL